MVVDKSSGRAFFHHAASGATQWTNPALEETDDAARVLAGERAENEAGGAVRHAALHAAEDEARRAASADRTEAGRAKRDTLLAAEAARKKALRKAKKKVRWKWKPQVAITLTESLLGDGTAGSSAAVPPFFSEICRSLFTAADRNRDGDLSVIEIVFFLKERAKGTALSRDSVAVFKFKSRMARQSAHGKITIREWELGIVEEMWANEDGAVAQWLLRELQDLASEWVAHATEDATFYVHATQGKTWTKPPLVAAVERVAGLREEGGAGDDTESSDEGNSSSSSELSSLSSGSSESGEDELAAERGYRRIKGRRISASGFV
jgi:hypothetical protein